ncbi:MAG: hypothetical protein INR73_28585 [Williamsia sp.]|nr:hypothetical protein [Williamsia sp.]
MPQQRTNPVRFLTISLLLSVLHHTDHILRIDHSGWPFIAPVSPFTYSLLVYPIFLSIFLNLKKLLYCIIATAFLFVVATGAHIFFEPLRDKYHTWTYGSDLPHHVGEQNKLGIHSPVLGVVSIAIAVLLSLALLRTLVAFIQQYRLQKR